MPESDKIKHQENVGYSGYDFCCFIIDNYDNLPDVCVFIKANVFNRIVNGRPEPHCNKEKFDKLINNNVFTSLESYENIPESYAHIKDVDGGYMEINNSWYIQDHVATHGVEVVKYIHNYNNFMNEIFINYTPPEYVRFAPGGNYIVPKENILFYSKKFWKKLKLCQGYHQMPSEAHTIERALYYIFTNKWEERMADE